MPHANNNFTISKSDSWRMFDAISSKYDFLNRLLSFGLDVLWRKRLAAFLPSREGLKVLDLATGTADALLALFKNNPNMQAGFGIDLSEKMLDIGRRKIVSHELEHAITLSPGDANEIPFNENTFDAATIAFGIRNVEDPRRVLNEMRRVLRPGGRAMILEFSLPSNKILRGLHLSYLRTVVPAIGGLVSGHGEAYRYLNRTIEKFPSGEDFCRLMRDAGFSHVKANPLCAGIATIYQGEKQ